MKFNPLRKNLTASFLMCVLLLSSNVVFAKQAVVVTSNDSITELTTSLSERLAETGYQVKIISDDDLSQIPSEEIDMVVVQDGVSLSELSIKPIMEYLHRGGDIVALRVPLWGQAQQRFESRHPSPTEPTQSLPATFDGHVIVNPAQIDLAQWQRSSNNLSSRTDYTIIEDERVPLRKALDVHISNRSGWDTYISPPLENPFPNDNDLTVIWAKGDTRTVELLVEWSEISGARWIATIPLTQTWQPYILRPEDFVYWQSSAPANPKQLIPSQASRLSFGMAFTHLSSFGGGENHYQIGPIYSCKSDAFPQSQSSCTSFPKLDTLSTRYKFFASNAVKKIEVCSIQAIVPPINVPLAQNVISCHPRATGNGFNKNRSWRWIPLLEAHDGQGQWRGNPASMLIHFDGDYKGGVWASFSIQDVSWYRENAVQTILGNILKRMIRPTYLVDGGANYFTYFKDQDIQLGLTAATVKMEKQNGLSYKINLRSCTNPSVYTFSENLESMPCTRIHRQKVYKPKNWPIDGYHVDVELRCQEKVIDRLSHPLYDWDPVGEKKFVIRKNGNFYLDGQRWRINGVNYLPSTGIASEDPFYFEQWLSRVSYEPTAVARDLKIIHQMGMNAVSIFIDHQIMSSQNLLDFFRLAREQNIKINLSLRPGTPMNFEWDKIRELIAYYRMADNDDVFAFDLAWEPSFGNQTMRQQWDLQWHDWIVERYASIENAEKDWGFKICRTETGLITNPLDRYFTENGPWGRMISAYRRFLDTLLYEKYSQARRLVQSIAPHQYVSFRMAGAGDPTHNSQTSIPYDWPYLAAAVDLFCPEAYGRLGTWEQIKPGVFTAYYAHWASPDLPVVWAEAGTTVWLRSRMVADDDQLKYQADFFKDFYRMLTISSADGIFYWWYPGGFRPFENSDYGIVNPDGTDRPVTKIIREYGKKFIQAPDMSPSSPKIQIDRDKYVSGLAGIYDKAKDDFWDAVNNGKNPILITEASGTNTANCPLVAVGNTAYNKSNPLKYIDGFIDEVKIKLPDNSWASVERNQIIGIPAGSSVYAMVSFTNLGQAEWLGKENTDSMYSIVNLRIEQNGKIRKIPIRHNLKRHESTVMKNILLAKDVNNPILLKLDFEIEDRGIFGNRFQLTITPE